MNYLTIGLALFATICFIWAIIATISAIKSHNTYKSTLNTLNIANSGLDNCLSYCGGPKNWAAGQVSRAGSIVDAILQNQSRIVCSDPTTAYPQLVSCVIGSVSQTQSYWNLVNPSNATMTSAIINSELDKCVPSVSGCKKQ